MPKRKQIDWEAIRQEYEADQLSNVEIGKRHDVTEGAIRKKAKKSGWKKSLSKRVREKVREKLVRDVRNDNATDDQIEEAAAERGAGVIRSHRKDIAKLREVEQKLLAELDDDPKKTWVGQYQGEVITKDLSITVTERASAHQALAAAAHKRILLERQAFNLDDHGGDGDTIEDRLKRIVEGG
jgi:hypothetical protein